MLSGDDPPEPPGAIEDERLRADLHLLSPGARDADRVALTLRMVGGLTMAEIVLPSWCGRVTVGQRITRAKAKIKAAEHLLPGAVAGGFPARVAGVLAVLSSSSTRATSRPAPAPIRTSGPDAEAIRLTRLIRALMPEDGEVAGLLALMLLTEARRAPPGFGERRTGRPRRAGPRGLDAALIAEGHRWCASAWPPGWLRVATGSSPPIAPCTPPPGRTQDTDWSTGRRPLRRSSSASTPRRSSPQPGHRGRPSLTAARSTGGRSAALRTSCRLSRLPCDSAPTCCAGWAASQKSRAAYDKAIELCGQDGRDRRGPDTPPRPAGVVPVETRSKRRLTPMGYAAQGRRGG